ncbi:flagellin FlaB [Natronoarchaeum philippinense]|uniref:Flagellin n=1 Tax=Natronoarchaeum philippinense TaxID=558529 RepID=A0A285NWK2_NATPI|nr:archaellin/type IV pilin N-terminal domain-containing protein [Natronoarchaeum philippinense]SNZ13417.1 flagellin FlaB [Natronoarchaeum philippinense]
MLPKPQRPADSRGQTGVETLVVFIATVIVAAIAAALLLNTVLALQSQAIATSEESIEQVTERVQVVTAFGEVDDGRIETVTLRVRTAPGAESIDLSAASVQTVGDGVDPNWSVGVVGSDRSVLTDGSELGYVHVYGESGLPADRGLTPGERVTVRITTGAGATTVYVVNVPDTLAGQSVVEV